MTLRGNLSDFWWRLRCDSTYLSLEPCCSVQSSDGCATEPHCDGSFWSPAAHHKLQSLMCRAWALSRLGQFYLCKASPAAHLRLLGPPCRTRQ